MKSVSTSKVRKPVLRRSSERYILLTLLSFALSVSTTRLFLSLTGYPQLGNRQLHIAHVLWGGLLLFIASLVPLIFANRWALGLDSILAGVGVGLFIDEVGKFITQTNNYFYPAAAPIIYALFLLTVLIYLQVNRKRDHDTRSELYGIISDLEEVLDYDLSDRERENLLVRLREVREHNTDANLANLVTSLEGFISSQSLEMVPENPGFIGKLKAWGKTFETRWIRPGRLRAALVGGFLALGIWALRNPVSMGFRLSTPDLLVPIFTPLVTRQILSGPTSLVWFNARLGLEFSIGLLFIVASFLMVFGKPRRGIWLGRLGLLLSLTVVNLLSFYFDQFSTIITAIIQLFMLLVVIYYRQRFLHKET
jgi:hypothetical protein